MLTIFLFLLLGTAVCDPLVAISGATSRSVYVNNYSKHGPGNAVDGDINTDFHSGTDSNSEWLKVTLDTAKAIFVEKVVIINR